MVQYGNKIDVIVAANDEIAMGALQPEFIEIPYELVTKDNLADYQ